MLLDCKNSTNFVLDIRYFVPGGVDAYVLASMPGFSLGVIAEQLVPSVL